MTNIYNPSLYLTYGIDPCKGSANLIGKLRNSSFKIQTSNEILDVRYKESGASNSFTHCSEFIVSMECCKNSEHECHKHISNVTMELSNAISLLTDSWYMETNISQRYIFPGSLRSNLQFSSSESPQGVYADNACICEPQKVQKILDKINSLSAEDYKKFSSAAHLVKNAKKKYARGETGASVAEGVAALEALYMIPNERKKYDQGDQRFIKNNKIINKRKAMFDWVFTNYVNNEIANKIKDSIDPYHKRSTYLHGGQLDLHPGPFPRSVDTIEFDFILQIQNAVISSLDVYMSELK